MGISPYILFRCEEFIAAGPALSGSIKLTPGSYGGMPLLPEGLASVIPESSPFHTYGDKVIGHP